MQTDGIREALLAEMVRRGLTKAELGRKLNISETAAGRLVNGRTRRILPSTEDALCRFFGVDRRGLLDIQEARTVRERPSAYEDKIDRLCRFIRTLGREQQESFFVLARGWGYRDTEADGSDKTRPN